MLKAKLRERFNPVPVATSARMSLDRLRQNTSVLNYNHQFTTLLALTDMATADRIHRYTQGLKPDVQREVIRSQPETLADAMNTALLNDSLLFSSHHSWARAPFQPTNNAPRTSASTGGGSAPMQLGHMGAACPDGDVQGPSEGQLNAALQPPLHKLADAERARLQREGGCFRCRKGGHISRDCPLNKGRPTQPKNGPGSQ
jgi:hypothetical protein